MGGCVLGSTKIGLARTEKKIQRVNNLECNLPMWFMVASLSESAYSLPLDNNPEWPDLIFGGLERTRSFRTQHLCACILAILACHLAGLAWESGHPERLTSVTYHQNKFVCLSIKNSCWGDSLHDSRRPRVLLATSPKEHDDDDVSILASGSATVLPVMYLAIIKRVSE